MLLGDEVERPSGSKLFCLYMADGTPFAISASFEAAMANAFEHDLLPMSVLSGLGGVERRRRSSRLGQDGV